MDLALTNAGEVTNGNSSYETQLLNYLNRVHFTLIAGGTIPLSKDTTVQIDEVWPWSKAKSPLLIELQPKYSTGTVTLTQGSEAGTFSAGPAASLKGYHIRVPGREEWYKIASHTAAATAFELDGPYADTTGSGLSFEAIKIDYELIPDYITVGLGNDNMQFQKTAGSTLTATLTHGTYTPAQLISHVATQMTTAASGPTITGAYSATTRKFTLTSDLAGGTAFYIVGNGSQSGFSIHKNLGYDDETSSASAAAQTSTYVLGGIARLVEPFRVHKGPRGKITSVDGETFTRDYPFANIMAGTPDRFTVIEERADGTFVVRFNGYPTERTRVEIEHVPVPRDLKDNSSSVPLVPRKYVDVLEDAATFYLMLVKNDDKVGVYSQLVQAKLTAMVSQHRGSLMRSGEHFGQIIPRRDNLSLSRKNLRYGYGDD